MEWIVWVTIFSFVMTVFLFTVLYSFSDIQCVWPPCVSELIEKHKSMTLFMLGFTTGLIWLNLIILSIVLRRGVLAVLATLIFLSVMGVFAFDLCEHKALHYMSVIVYTASSTAYANMAVSIHLIYYTAAVDCLTLAFLLAVAYTALFDEWHKISKYLYTGLECCWILSFCIYAIAHAFENRFNYNSLFFALECTPSTLQEYEIHEILAAVIHGGR